MSGERPHRIGGFLGATIFFYEALHDRLAHGFVKGLRAFAANAECFAETLAQCGNSYGELTHSVIDYGGPHGRVCGRDVLYDFKGTQPCALNPPPGDEQTTVARRPERRSGFIKTSQRRQAQRGSTRSWLAGSGRCVIPLGLRGHVNHLIRPILAIANRILILFLSRRFRPMMVSWPLASNKAANGSASNTSASLTMQPLP